MAERKTPENEGTGQTEEASSSSDLGTSRPRGKSRQTPPGCPSPSQRVAHIVDLMARGRWYLYRSRVKLAAEWGIAEATIRKDAAEAHRRLAADPDEVEQGKRELAEFCARERRKASRERSNVTGLTDIAAALKAAELEAKFRDYPVGAPTRVELSGKGGGPVALSLDDIAEVLKAGRDNMAEDADDGKPGGKGDR